MSTFLHAISIDVEDWYQSSYDFDAPLSNICVQNTRLVLDLLERRGIRGTFFVQGMIARQYPNLIKEIDGKGHEIQSHGFSHRPVNRMSPNAFRQELVETNKCLEDITGKPVTGFRAPDFSIDEQSFWAFEVMHECGIRYDSSIFPLRTKRYGIRGFQRGYSIIKTPSGFIHELPVSVLDVTLLKDIRIPVGGGGYFRLFPVWFLNFSMKKLEKTGLPFIIYCHPYEFNPDEWRLIVGHISGYRRLHQGLGRRGFRSKVLKILESGSFGTMSEVLERLQNKEEEQKCV